jgi:hypothetical protein
MKLQILYHPNSEHSTFVERYAQQMRESSNGEVELVSLETNEGSSLGLTYAIVQYPAILVIRDDGQLYKHWEGSEYPQVDEVIGYLKS